MKTHSKQLLPIAALTGLVVLSGCVTDPNSPGLEYMPDMYRSAAIEAYVDYGMDEYAFGWAEQADQRLIQSARKPVKGSIAFQPDAKEFAMPYPYPNTPAGYESAGRELTSPLATTKAHIEEGKAIYTQMCTQCHGEKGEGDGALSRNGHIQGIPSYSGKLKDLPVGNMYHTLTYGKGLMGSHASQLDQRDRWLVIEYIKVLQNGGELPEFDEAGNAVESASAEAGATAMND